MGDQNEIRNGAMRLLIVDQSLPEGAYFGLGKRRLDKYAIEADGVLWDGTSTVNLETAKERLAAYIACGYEDARVVRVVTFTQDVET